MHTKEVVAIKIGFENCEVTKKLTVRSIDLDGEPDVDYVCLKDISESVCTMAVNYTSRFKACKKAEIILNPQAEKKSNGKGMFSDCKLFERICDGNDITDIQIVFSDKSHETIFVPWRDGETSYQNLLMKTDMTEDGKLEIVIEEKKVK